MMGRVVGGHNTKAKEKQVNSDTYKVNYLAQGKDSCCVLYALCNALRFFGKDSPEPSQDEWKNLAGMIGCSGGAAIFTERVAWYLGLRRIKVPFDLIEPPAMLSVINPNPRGHTLHATLMIGQTGRSMTLVNYRAGKKPLIEEVPIFVIRFRGFPNNRCHNIRLVIKDHGGCCPGWIL